MKPKISLVFGLIIIVCVSFFLWNACQTSPTPVALIGDDNIRVEFNELLYSRVVAIINGKTTVISDYAPSEFVTVVGNDITDFALREQTETAVDDNIGSGTRLSMTGESESLRKEINITVYDDFHGMAVYEVAYTNMGDSDVQIDRWVNNHYQVKRGKETPAFWSFQSGSYESRPDWVLPLQASFTQENYMGMNATDYGGGTPVVDIWRRDAGIGVGHLEMEPKLVSLPVKMPDEKAATLGVEYKADRLLKPAERLNTFKTFVSVHQGDYFHTLIEYRRFMEKQGIKLAEYPESTYEPIWCAWGYEHNYTMEQVYNTLPKAKELGFKWAVLDDGWQTAEGDWYLTKEKYPTGDSDMLKFTQTIREGGLRPKIWWAPLAVDPGTDLIKDHPDYLLLNEDGSKQEISWWDAYYLCPAYPPVQEYTKKLVEKIMKTWDYDGLKIDGQHLNGAPPCYNPVHKHAYPEESFEKVPEFFKVIYETALSIKPDAVVEICPCGSAYAFHTMPNMNQPVASDPTSSWQIRLKGKTLKALMGVSMPYYGDHVELSDGNDDFASTVGIGGVVGTKFTWPAGAKKDSEVELTPEKEAFWKKWVSIYLEKMLSKGIYRGELYDLGYDRPETHAVQKDDNMYYAFYADAYQGKVQLRGLENKSYRVMDYENNKDMGTVRGAVGELTVDFKNHLLLEALPE
jgi:alpha-galactosidase